MTLSIFESILYLLSRYFSNLYLFRMLKSQRKRFATEMANNGAIGIVEQKENEATATIPAGT